MRVYFRTMPSPVGPLLLLSDGTGLTGVYLDGHRGGPTPGPDWRQDAPILGEAADQLAAYFAGALEAFRLPLAPRGTPFQLRVWELLRGIPYGATATYADLARRHGRPTAARAVGMANARNPLSIVVPCHRVVGTGGALTGYAGGLARKRWLLDHEGAAVSPAAGRGR